MYFCIGNCVFSSLMLVLSEIFTFKNEFTSLWFKIDGEKCDIDWADYFQNVIRVMILAALQ